MLWPFLSESPIFNIPVTQEHQVLMTHIKRRALLKDFLTRR